MLNVVQKTGRLIEKHGMLLEVFLLNLEEGVVPFDINAEEYGFSARLIKVKIGIMGLFMIVRGVFRYLAKKKEGKYKKLEEYADNAGFVLTGFVL